MRNSRARKVSLLGMLFALAIVLSFFESLITPFFGLPPGIKLGLANVVVMYALYYLGKKEAFVLVLLKALFAVFTRGVSAGMLSLAGGLLSFILMVLLLLPKQKPSVVLVSIVGALGHNFGQFAMARLLLGPSFVVYAPVLLVSGVVMGILTALCFRVLTPALEKTGLTKEMKNNRNGQNPPSLDNENTVQKSIIEEDGEKETTQQPKNRK